MPPFLHLNDFILTIGSSIKASLLWIGIPDFTSMFPTKTSKNSKLLDFPVPANSSLVPVLHLILRTPQPEIADP